MKFTGILEPIQSIEEMAAAYIAEMQKVDPVGPYTIGGYSFGARVAYEMAVQLERNNFKVASLVIFDAEAPHLEDEEPMTMAESVQTIAGAVANWSGQELILEETLLEEKTEEEKFQLLQRSLQALHIDFTLNQLKGVTKVIYTNSNINYRPAYEQGLAAPIKLLATEDFAKRSENQDDQAYDGQWQALTKGNVEITRISGNHLVIFETPHVEEIAKYLNQLPGKK